MSKPTLGKRSQRAKPPLRAAVARSAVAPHKLRPPRLLTYVDAVARHGSIRKAAEALNVASSALNRQILDLEADLGSALFERLPRGVRLTAAGEVFLAYARQAISELKAVELQVEQLRGLVRGQVGVAAVELVAGELLPSAITQFQATHPNVRFNVRIGAPEDLVAVLIADQVDLILTHYPPPKKHVAVVATVTQALCALMVADHPLAGRDESAATRLPRLSAGARRHVAGRAGFDRAGAVRSLVRPRSASGVKLGRDHEGICAHEPRRMFSIPQARQGVCPARQHGGATAYRSCAVRGKTHPRHPPRSRAAHRRRSLCGTAPRSDGVRGDGILAHDCANDTRLGSPSMVSRTMRPSRNSSAHDAYLVLAC